MGMYDYVLYEGREYQSKSTDRMLDYYIVKDDRLFVKKTFIACVPYQSEGGSWEAVRERLLKQQETSEVIFQELIPARVHGVIEIHDLDEDMNSIQKYLKFTDDILIEVWDGDGRPREQHGCYVNVDLSEWNKKVREWEENHYQDWLNKRKEK